MANNNTDKLTDILIKPREDLDIEIKNWLDLKSNEDDKANFAKAALALANHGGGLIIFGFTEIAAGMIPAAERPATLDGYRADLLNGIIHKYADPAFHCEVHLRPGPQDEIYPVVVVPGGHRVPVRSKRGGPHSQIVKDNSIYIRRPGPQSEVPQNANDWDTLLGRCLSNRRDEMFDQIRALITGAVPPPALPPPPDSLEIFIEASLARWKTLAATLPQGAAERCPHGFNWYAFELGGDIRNFSGPQFAEILRSAEVKYSGWPPFWYPTRSGIAPYPFDEMVECWIGGDTDDGYGNRGAGRADFWRVSPAGLAFFLRGYREDDLAGGDNMPADPGSWIEVEWPVAVTAQILLYVQSLAARLIDGPTSVRLRSGYNGLYGRSLHSITGRHLSPRVSRQDEINLESTFATEALEHNLVEIAHPFLTPLYRTFDFFELPMKLVTEVIGKLRQRRF